MRVRALGQRAHLQSLRQQQKWQIPQNKLLLVFSRNAELNFTHTSDPVWVCCMKDVEKRKKKKSIVSLLGRFSLIINDRSVTAACPRCWRMFQSSTTPRHKLFSAFRPQAEILNCVNLGLGLSFHQNLLQKSIISFFEIMNCNGKVVSCCMFY